MKRWKAVRYLLYFGLLFGVLGGLFGGQIVLAQENEEQTPPEEPVEEKLELTSSFPVLRGESGSSFEFEVIFNYQAGEPRVFEFAYTAPPGWEASVKRTWGTEDESILAIRLEAKDYPDRAKIFLSPLPGNLPESGEYVLTFEAASDGLKDNIELKAVVTEMPLTYELEMVTQTGRLDYPAVAGKDNPLTVTLTNKGTGAVKDISLMSVKSEGWGVTFTPNRLESLEPEQSKEVEVVITPPRKTIAGDYRPVLRAIGDKAADSIDLRVTVQTPTIWGGAGIGIIAAVIVGLAFLFRRLGRR